MNNSLINISFEVTDNYTREDFRVYIKHLLAQDDKYNLFIISNDPSTEFIDAIGEVFGIPSTHRVAVGTNEEKIDFINDFKINIHLDNIQSTVEMVDNSTNAYGILVNSEWDKYKVKLKYAVQMELAIKQVIKDRLES